jgi:drug/metabolite transporter (DMT)-like permease
VYQTDTHPLNLRLIKSDGLLLLTAVIWGFAFVAQRVGMEFVGPFTFNGIRFALGAIVLIPFVLKNDAKLRRVSYPSENNGVKMLVLGGGLAGLALFSGASLQQVGLVYTTAGKAGFITGLYVVIVPILGLFFRQRTNAGTWIGALLAAVGLYFLSITGTLSISLGDFLELAGALFWAAHVLIIAWLSPRMYPLKLALMQFTTCSALSLFTAAVYEDIGLQAVLQAAIPILYGGALSVGIAYTLQVVAQRNAHPAHAAILLSLESVFAAIGGWIVLGETLSYRGLMGCGLMLAGMLLSQLWGLIHIPAVKVATIKPSST